MGEMAARPTPSLQECRSYPRHTAPPELPATDGEPFGQGTPANGTSANDATLKGGASVAVLACPEVYFGSNGALAWI